MRKVHKTSDKMEYVVMKYVVDDETSEAHLFKAGSDFDTIQMGGYGDWITAKVSSTLQRSDRAKYKYVRVNADWLQVRISSNQPKSHLNNDHNCILHILC